MCGLVTAEAGKHGSSSSKCESSKCWCGKKNGSADDDGKIGGKSASGVDAEVNQDMKTMWENDVHKEY